MSDWDFLWDIPRTPQEIYDATSSGATAEERDYLEKHMNEEPLGNKAAPGISRLRSFSGKKLSKKRRKKRG